MALKGTQHEKLCCSICLDLLEVPVTLPCGHSYCMSCITHCWDEEEKKKELCSCPQCRRTFMPRPELVRNTMLADFVEDEKKAGVQAASSDGCYAGSEDVSCHAGEFRAHESCEEDVVWDLLQISDSLNEADVPLPPPEPKTRAELLQYSRQLTLDPNTAHTRLLLSEGNRKATVVKQRQPYSDHPDRFDGWCQVLSAEALTGRVYWEVKWSGWVWCSVTYEDIDRKGQSDDCAFGFNENSWSLDCDSSGYSFNHKNNHRSISGPVSSTVGVYLDTEEGTLSFYSVSETVTLLHRVQTSFSQPLWAGLGLWFNPGVTAELCHLL